MSLSWDNKRSEQICKSFLRVNSENEECDEKLIPRTIITEAGRRSEYNDKGTNWTTEELQFDFRQRQDSSVCCRI
jgi:hypothetical protein